MKTDREYIEIQREPNPNVECSLKRNWMESVLVFNIVL
jgi:hypothetical protein